MPRVHPSKKEKNNLKPIVLSASVHFMFWNNENEKYRNKVLRNLCKTLREKFNLSAIPLYDDYSLEEGSIIIAIALAKEKDANALMEKVLHFIEDNAEARVSSDSWSKHPI